MSDPTTYQAAPTPPLRADMPPSFSDLFDKSLARTKDAHEKMTTIFESMNQSFHEAFTCANKGSAEYGMKVLQIARAHANAVFDIATESMTAKSPAEFLELSSAHARKHLELAAGHMKELTTLAQRVVNETTAPIRTGMTEPFKLAS